MSIARIITSPLIRVNLHVVFLLASGLKELLIASQADDVIAAMSVYQKLDAMMVGLHAFDDLNYCSTLISELLSGNGDWHSCCWWPGNNSITVCSLCKKSMKNTYLTCNWYISGSSMLIQLYFSWRIRQNNFHLVCRGKFSTLSLL